jgi:hypothetical protein
MCNDARMAGGILLNAIDVPYTVSCLMPDNGLALLAACLIGQGHRAEVWDLGTVSTLRDLVGTDDRTSLQTLLAAMERGALGPEHVEQLRVLDERVVDGLRTIYRALFARLERRVAAGGVDFIGLKLWMGAGYRIALELAAELKKRHPRLEVFAGGPVGTLAAELLLATHPVLTAVCVGDGEEAIVGLAEHCDGRRALCDVPNMAIREGAGVRLPRPHFTDLNTLPVPAYDPDIYAATAGAQSLPIPCIDESRGCPMGCHFCAHSRLSGGRWRVREAEGILAEMDACRQTLGARAFRFAGSYTPSSVYREVADRLLASGVPTLYSGFAHISGTKIEDLPTLRRSGLVALFFGVESGAPELLRGPLGKKIVPQKAREVLAACLDAGIFVSASIIFPSPGETDETEAQTVGLLTELFAGRTGECSVPVQPAFPQPGSQWWKDFESYGFSGDRQELLEAICSLRVRHLLPVSLWEPPPYGMDGHGIAYHTARTTAFARKLESRGILTGMADEAVLIGAAAGYEPREFHRLQRRIFVTADAEAMQDIISRVREGRGTEPPAQNTE